MERTREITKGPWTFFFSGNTPVAALHENVGIFRTGMFHRPSTSMQITAWLKQRPAAVRPQSFFDALVDDLFGPSLFAESEKP